MTMFNETLHPRGQAANAGQFRAKENAAQDSELGDGISPFTKEEQALGLQQYIGTALWSSTDEEGTPLDGEYDESDMSDELRTAMAEDWDAFTAANGETLARVCERPEYDASSAAHDFWLTRNGHGAGFWDRGLGDDGIALTEAAKPFGSVDIYVGDDGKLYA